MKRAFVLLLLVGAAPVLADQVYVKGGGVLTGMIVSRDERFVVLEVGPGRVAFPMSRVERVVEGRSSLATYHERAAALGASDVAGWLELGQWAGDQGLRTQARECYSRVLALDPANPAAHRALGDVLFGGRWMSQEESYRAQGLVPFEGQWLTPAERSSLIRERTEAAVAASARSEADARAREAEARARQAEADARRAETANESTDSGGFPYPWVFGSGVCHVGCGPRVRPSPRPAPTPPPKPAATPRPASLR